MEHEAKSFTNQLREFEALESLIKKRTQEAMTSRAEEPYQSKKTEQLCAALASAQGEFPVITNNRYNNFLFAPYADLDILAHAVRPMLKENKLSVTFQIKLYGEKTILVTTLRHESDQFIESRCRIIPSKNDVQTFFSNEQAMKRQSFKDILNITTVGDLDDDDGELDMKEVRKDRNAGTGINMRYSAKKESYRTITQDQAANLDRLLSGDNADIAEELLESLKIQTLADIPDSKYAYVHEQAMRKVNFRIGKGGQPR